MKKVLILANYDLGLYKFRKELIQALIEQGCKVYIALPYGKLVEPLKQMGCHYTAIQVDRRGVNPLRDLSLLVAYSRLIKQIKPDRVITYTIKPNIYGGMICRGMKVPYYANITGLGTAFQKDGILKKIIIQLYKQALKKAKYVFFENQDNREKFLEHRIVYPQQAVRFNGAGVNLEEYSFIPMNEEKAINFLFIGRVMKEKGIEELFQVATRIRRHYPQVNFHIVGPFEENYGTQVKVLHEQGIIRYHGYQEDVRPFIAESHCFVLPSYHEGMANTLLEAAAMGRALITSNIPGCREAVNDNGYTVEVQDEEDLYAKVEAFIKLSPDTRVALSKQSRKHMEAMFDKSKIVAKTIQYISG